MQAAESLEQLHLHFIRATPEAVWEAITSPEKTSEYYHGLEVESDFQESSGIRYVSRAAGERVPVIRGRVLEVVEGRRLAHTFQFVDADDPPTQVTWEIEDVGNGVTRLQVVHDGFDGETKTYTTTRTGWAPIFSGLKTLLETGESLAIATPADDGHNG